MVRLSRKGVRPSAAGRFAKSSEGDGNGLQVAMSELTTPEDLWELVSDCVECGSSVTFRMTRSKKTVAVVFFVDGEQFPWYLQTSDDWDAMRVATAVDQT